MPRGREARGGAYASRELRDARHELRKERRQRTQGRKRLHQTTRRSRYGEPFGNRESDLPRYSFTCATRVCGAFGVAPQSARSHLASRPPRHGQGVAVHRLDVNPVNRLRQTAKRAANEHYDAVMIPLDKQGGLLESSARSTSRARSRSGSLVPDGARAASAVLDQRGTESWPGRSEHGPRRDPARDEHGRICAAGGQRRESPRSPHGRAARAEQTWPALRCGRRQTDASRLDDARDRLVAPACRVAPTLDGRKNVPKGSRPPPTLRSPRAPVLLKKCMKSHEPKSWPRSREWSPRCRDAAPDGYKGCVTTGSSRLRWVLAVSAANEVVSFRMPEPCVMADW